MADVFFRVGGAGLQDGTSPANAGDVLDFLDGTWGGAFSVLNDVAVFARETLTLAGSLTMSQRGSAGFLNWLWIRIADPGEFAGDVGAGFKVVTGGSFSNRMRWARYTWVYSNTAATELITEHPGGGDAFLYAAFPGPARYDVDVRCRTGAAGSQLKYPAIGDASNGNNLGTVHFNTLILENQATGGNSPALFFDGNGNHAHVRCLVIDTSGGDRYDSGALQAGNNTFDAGNRLSVERCEVIGADNENSYLFWPGSVVSVDFFDAPLMSPWAPDVATTTGYGACFAGGLDNTPGAVASCGAWGRRTNSLSGEPTLQGDTYEVRPSTVANNLDFGRAEAVFEVPEMTRREAAQTRTISLELLINAALDALADTSNVWIEVTYWADGGSKVASPETTRAAVAGTGLTASAAAWSGTNHLGQELTARKIELTTSQAVRPGSEITVRLFWTVPGSVSTDLFLVDSRTLVEAA